MVADAALTHLERRATYSSLLSLYRVD